MFNFFAKSDMKQGDCYFITGNDFNHIKNVLRMNIGDSFLVSFEGKSDLCKLKSLEDDTAIAQITEENYRDTSLPLEIHLFQGLPKSDKMELIIQKCVELGAFKIVPVEMNRCVVKLDDKKKSSKLNRWQAISENAAKQSKRNIIPEIGEVLSYSAALEAASKLDLLLVPYECEEGMAATKKALSLLKDCKSVGILIGPEGGFEESEIEKALNMGGKVISLGKRILRTETAAIASVSMCMLAAELR